MVSHNPDDARRVAELTAFVHDGRVLAAGATAELLDRPTLPELADYLGVAVGTG
jgi:ABC-type phosphate transport system ATPase subunit